MTDSCSVCGTTIGEDWRFCEGCGTPVEHARKCRDCGAALSTTARFCSLCGTAVSTAAPGPSARPITTFRDRLKDGGEGPEMVIIPPGTFLMGSTPADKEASRTEFPQHRVAIAYPFAVGKFPITIAEYRQHAAMGGRGHLSPDRERGCAEHPMQGVRWEDANAYCEWLSGQTGARYRLLSEAEWEYVCRAGTTTRYWWGDEIGDGNCACDGGWSEGGRTGPAPVGSFSPNPFGVCDMHGNVREWLADRWSADYHGAPDNGLPRSDGDGEDRVTRGGCWLFKPKFVRAAARSSAIHDFMGDGLGFRVARAISEPGRGEEE